MKSSLTLIILLLTFYSISSSQVIVINYDTHKSNIKNLYINTEAGIFKISDTGKLQSIIIGNYDENYFDIIDYFELRNKRAKLQIAETKIYIKNLISINYPTEYYANQISKSSPNEINGYQLKYYDSYYDNELVKTKIKSIGDVKIEYYTDYYLNKQIIGKIKSIGKVLISYSDTYYDKDIIGNFKEIGNINIEYYTNEHYKDFLNNKIKSIGNLQINYFDQALNTEHNGEFKNISGSDSRFIMVNDY